MDVYGNRSVPHVRHAKSAIVWLRILSSLAWLDSAFVGKDAKLSPTFLSGVGLTKVAMEKFLHTAIFPWVADLLQNLVLPHAQLFAVLIALTDAAIVTCAGRRFGVDRILIGRSPSSRLLRILG